MEITSNTYSGPFDNELEERLAYVHQALIQLQTSLKYVMRDDENIQQAFIESGSADAILDAMKRMKTFCRYWEDPSIASPENCLEKVKRASQHPPQKWDPAEHSFFFVADSAGKEV